MKTINTAIADYASQTGVKVLSRSIETINERVGGKVFIEACHCKLSNGHKATFVFCVETGWELGAD